MDGLRGLRITGLVFASLAMLVAMGSECFYIWKAVDSIHWCYYDELEMRTWLGIGEGIVGMILGVSLIVGFVYIIVWVLWVWVVWALGITGFNAYCIYFYIKGTWVHMPGPDPTGSPTSPERNPLLASSVTIERRVTLHQVHQEFDELAYPEVQPA